MRTRQTILLVVSLLLSTAAWGLLGAASGCTVGFVVQPRSGPHPFPWFWMICGGAIVGIVVGAVWATLRLRAGKDLWQ
jgi:hypothetical protein